MLATQETGTAAMRPQGSSTPSVRESDLILEPYDANDLLELLRLRVEKALDRAKIEEAAVRKIAAYASRELSASLPNGLVIRVLQGDGR